MKIRFISDFARNWKAGDIVEAQVLPYGDTLVDGVAIIDTRLLMEHCEVITESEAQNGILDGSFSMELNHPLDEESWKIIEDAELDNTEHMWFTTPSGKRVDFIKADVLDKIRTEVEGMTRVILKDTPEDDWAVKWNECVDEVLQLIDKYREGEE